MADDGKPFAKPDSEFAGEDEEKPSQIGSKPKASQLVDKGIYSRVMRGSGGLKIKGAIDKSEKRKLLKPVKDEPLSSDNMAMVPAGADPNAAADAAAALPVT